MDSSNSGPYVSSPFTLPPYDSLGPISLPDYAPPYCIYPPNTPQPPSTAIPPPAGSMPSSPPPPFYYPPPVFPILNPPPSPTGAAHLNQYLIHRKAVPRPPYYEPSPPSYTPSPPTFVPSPTGFRSKSTEHSPTCGVPTSDGATVSENRPQLSLMGQIVTRFSPNGPCFEPNTLFVHASYAFNSYWQRSRVAGGLCSFGGTAILVTMDPSYDGCHFMYE
ncbi:BETA-13 GLUCANASE [Salix koriyanagi]|uniref:BETA-13 GLUCANASE n=1 Tax=Salix koriyanagi TaxID=2511006 RepID=A0A9Q1AIF8_9ROSI|nr:BETA-13 GLUCANASE [Salix koriyanagi]